MEHLNDLYKDWLGAFAAIDARHEAWLEAQREAERAEKEKEQRAHADNMAEMLKSKFKVTRA
jgi:hypothetical protein